MIEQGNLSEKILKKYLIKTIQRSTIKEVEFESGEIKGNPTDGDIFPLDIPGEKKLVIVYK